MGFNVMKDDVAEKHRMSFEVERLDKFNNMCIVFGVILLLVGLFGVG